MARGKRRLLLIVGLVLGVVLVAVVLALPPIAGPIGKRIIQGAVNDSIQGEIEIDSLSVSWLGSQRVSRFRLLDTDGSEIASGSATIGAGLLPLALGSRDLGEIAIELTATVRELADGTTDLQRAIAPTKPAAPSPSAPSGEPSIPSGLAADIALAAPRVLFVPQRGDTVGLHDLTATARLRAGKDAAITLDARTVRGTPDAQSPDGGVMDVDGTITGWSTAGGALTLDTAQLDFTLVARDLPVRAIDGVAAMDGMLERSLGERVSLEARAAGTLERGTATAELASAGGIRGSLAVAIADGVATAAGPIELVAPIARLIAADATVEQNLTGADAALRLTTRGELRMTVTELRVPTDPADLGRALAVVRIEPSEAIAGSLRRESGEGVPFRIDGLGVTATLRDGSAALDAGGSATVDGTDGGAFRLVASTGSLVGADGAFGSFDANRATADLAVRGLDTSLIDPLLAGISDGSLTAADSIGPRLELGVQLEPGDAPGVRIANLAAQSERFNAQGTARIGEDSITTTQPIVVRAADAGTGREGSLRIAATVNDYASATRTIDASLESRAFPTAWLSPIVAAFQTAGSGEIDLVSSVGPSLDGTITARIDADAATPDPLELSLSAEHLRASASLVMADDRLTLSGSAPARLEAERAAGLAASLAPAELGLGGNGSLVLAIERLSLPLGGEDAIGQSQIRGTIDAAGWSASLRDGAVEMPRLALTFAIADRQAAITGDGTVSGPGGRAGAIELALQSPIPQETGSLDAWRAAKPTARAALRDFPVALLDELGVPSGVKGVSIRQLAGGPLATVQIDLAPQQDALVATANLTATSARVSAGAELAGRTVRVRRSTANLNVGLATLDAITGAFMPDNELAPRLQEPASIAIAIEPIEIPLTDALAIDRDNLGDRAARVSATISADLKSFNMTGEDGVETFRSGPIVAKDLAVRAVAPLATVLAQGATPIELSIVGPIRNRAGLLITDLDAGAAVRMTPMAVDARVALGSISSEWVEGRVAIPSLTQLVGETPSVRATIALATPSDQATGDGADAGLEPHRATLAIDGGPFTTTQPLALRFTPEAIALESPLRAQWQGSAEALAQLAGGGEDGLRFAEGVTASLELATLRLPRGEGAPTVAASLSTTPIVILDTRAAPTTLGRLSATVGNRADDATTIDLDARLAADGQDRPVAVLDAAIAGLGGEAGPGLSGTATVNNAPTALIDALSMRDDLFSDVLGSTVNAEITLDRVPADGGSIRGSMNSPFATMSIAGSFEAGQFTITEQTGTEQSGAELRSFSPGLNERLTGAMPLVGGVTKTANDGPAFLRVNSLSYPIDGDLSKLDANITLDIGEATIFASRLFDPLLSLANWRTTAAVGQRLQPITVAITDGVARYDTVRIPLGEFVVEASGSIDLGKRQQDLVFGIPFGALSQEFATSIRSDFASQLNRIPGLNLQNATLPFVVRGSLDENNAPRLDMELFIRQTVGDAVQPENLLRGILEQGLNRNRNRSDGGGDGSGGGAGGGSGGGGGG